MSNQKVAHKQDKSELQKFELFYEHVNDGKPTSRSHSNKRSNG